MAEIKSTLDLVMEKTKHLSFSEEEKEAQRIKEIQKALTGIIQKYQDELLSEAELNAQLEHTKKDFKLEDDRLFLDGIVSRITLTQDNRTLFDLLKRQFGVEVAAIRAIIDRYNDTLSETADRRKNQAKAELQEEYGISGSAVLPNLNADPDWDRALGDITQRFDRDLTVEKERYHT